MRGKGTTELYYQISVNNHAQGRSTIEHSTSNLLHLYVEMLDTRNYTSLINTSWPKGVKATHNIITQMYRATRRHSTGSLHLSC